MKFIKVYKCQRCDSQFNDTHIRDSSDGNQYKQEYHEHLCNFDSFITYKSPIEHGIAISVGFDEVLDER